MPGIHYLVKLRLPEWQILEQTKYFKKT
jgi:hypothetical protein